MIGYVTIGVKDLDAGVDYWGKVLEPLGAKPLMNMERMVIFGTGPGAALLAVCLPYDGKPATAGNGNMLAFTVPSKEDVDKLYAKAIELGGSDEGEPGDRGGNFYGGYFRDPDGNKAVFYHMG